jgi:tellurite resistance protein TerC
MAHQLLFWILFNAFVLLALVVDLGLFHRDAHVVRFREALATTAVWVGLAAAFAVGVYFWHGRPATLEFTTGYLVELALSVDNLFVFLLVFRYFKVPALYQHKVLFWGIIGALLMRGVFILLGVTLIRRFDWTIYLFGAFLVYAGIKMAFEKEPEIQPEKNPLLRAVRRAVPVTPEYVEGNFFVLRGGLWATPLLLVLLVVELTDVLFAVDSIPAILAITRDPFIVYTSNVFAILGLRAMYFALTGMMELFHLLNYGLAAILVFIGAKMLASNYYQIPTGVTLAVVAAVLALSVGLSVVFPERKEETSQSGVR